jgi:Fur family transcriptional regulator, peroxide stress response regulator
MNKITKIIKNLRKKEVKVTAQRLAIIDFLASNPIHPSAEDIFNGIKTKFPTISLATIYNTLEKLEEIGELIKLKVAENNKVNYEYNLKPHNHFYCRICSQIYDIWEDVSISEDKIDGHLIENVQISYKGLCQNCFELSKTK